MTFRNLSRDSDLHEKTYARQFSTLLTLRLQRVGVRHVSSRPDDKIAAIDCTFGAKSGKHTNDFQKPCMNGRLRRRPIVQGFPNNLKIYG